MGGSTVLRSYGYSEGEQPSQGATRQVQKSSPTVGHQPRALSATQVVAGSPLDLGSLWKRSICSVLGRQAQEGRQGARLVFLTVVPPEPSAELVETVLSNCFVNEK